MFNMLPVHSIKIPSDTDVVSADHTLDVVEVFCWQTNKLFHNTFYIIQWGTETISRYNNKSGCEERNKFIIVK